jgi:protein-disulfide isomerase
MSSLEENKIKIKKSFWPVLITVVVLVALSLFVWRVVRYMELIRSGEIIDWQGDRSREMSIGKIVSAVTAPSAGAVSLNLTNEPSLGEATAPLTVVLFGDFECPYSRQASLAMRSLAYQYGQRVRYVYKDFPLTDIHVNARLAAEAAACADDQGRFWDMHDRLYQNQVDLSREALLEHARVLNLETGRFIACLDNNLHEDEIMADYQEGLAVGVYGTPTFFLNGQQVNGLIPTDILAGLVEKMTPVVR